MTEVPTLDQTPPPTPRSRRTALEKLRQLQRELGTEYAALEMVLAAARKVPDRLEERLLTIEGRRGVLGRAHRRWTQHSAAANREVWTDWDWGRSGEEWTASPEWKASLIEDVLEPTMPSGGVLLEIGPGAGRWSEPLHQRARRLILVDLTDRTLELCRERLGNPDDLVLVRNDGASLPGVGDGSIDGIWSFDVFVHVAPLDVAAYLDDIARVLRPGALAVLHHADRRRGVGWRAPMTGPLLASLARERGLSVERQLDSWREGRFGVRDQGDLISVLARPV